MREREFTVRHPNVPWHEAVKAHRDGHPIWFTAMFWSEVFMPEDKLRLGKHEKDYGTWYICDFDDEVKE